MSPTSPAPRRLPPHPRRVRLTRAARALHSLWEASGSATLVDLLALVRATDTRSWQRDDRQALALALPARWHAWIQHVGETTPPPIRLGVVAKHLNRVAITSAALHTTCLWACRHDVVRDPERAVRRLDALDLGWIKAGLRHPTASALIGGEGVPVTTHAIVTAAGQAADAPADPSRTAVLVACLDQWSDTLDEARATLHKAVDHRHWGALPRGARDQVYDVVVLAALEGWRHATRLENALRFVQGEESAAALRWAGWWYARAMDVAEIPVALATLPTDLRLAVLTALGERECGGHPVGPG